MKITRYIFDCLKGLKSLDDESVDLIITSPPYNLGIHKIQVLRNTKPIQITYEEEYRVGDRHSTRMLSSLKSDGSMMYQHKNRIKKGVQISPYEWIFKSSFYKAGNSLDK